MSSSVLTEDDLTVFKVDSDKFKRYREDSDLGWAGGEDD